MSSATRKKESSAFQVDNSEVSQYLLGKSLLSDLKAPGIETFKTELGFQCRAGSAYWPWEERKLGTIFTATWGLQYGISISWVKEIELTNQFLTICHLSSLLPPRPVLYCYYTGKWNGGNMFNPVLTQAAAEQTGKSQISLVATLETQYLDTREETIRNCTPFYPVNIKTGWNIKVGLL